MNKFYEGGTYFSEFLRTDSDDFNLNGDYSSALTEASITCEADEQLRIHRTIIFIEDSGAVTAGNYGALSALTNNIGS